MKDIPQSKKSEKIWIVLLKNQGEYALYLNKTDNCFAGFEVHKIRVKPAREHDIKCKDGSVHHVSTVERRAIASSEEFGKYAWHYPNIEMVYEKYPQFKIYSQEIESSLNDALISMRECVSRDGGEKTSLLHTRYSTLSQNANVTFKKCAICSKPIKRPYIHTGDGKTGDTWYCCWDCWLRLNQSEKTDIRGVIRVRRY